MDGFDPEGADDEPYLVCSHLIACHTLWYDNTNPDSGYTLGRVIAQVRPPAGHGYPYRIHRLFLYVQLHGTPGEYTLRARFVHVGRDEDGEEEEAVLRHLGPWEIGLPGDNYVECYGFPVGNVFLPDAGVYEFQLWADGFEVALASERFLARE